MNEYLELVKCNECKDIATIKRTINGKVAFYCSKCFHKYYPTEKISNKELEEQAKFPHVKSNFNLQFTDSPIEDITDKENKRKKLDHNHNKLVEENRMMNKGSYIIGKVFYSGNTIAVKIMNYIYTGYYLCDNPNQVVLFFGDNPSIVYDLDSQSIVQYL